MLLAILELAERGVLERNEIPYLETLEGFAAYFDLVKGPRRRVTNEYESALRQAEGQAPVAIPADAAARDPAFRRLVLEAYDYRRAASGWRVVVPGGPALAKAAHLIPFAETHDDHPRNGIALAPTFHRALDARLIASGPDMRWYVSEVLDRRIPDNGPLVQIAGEHVIFHGNQRLRPREDALRWRVEQLRTRSE